MKIRRSVWSIGIVTTMFAVAIASTARLEAQPMGPQSFLGDIIAKLDAVLAVLTDQGTAVADLQATVNDVQTTVGEVQTTVDGIPGVLVTAELTSFGKGVSCSVTNAGATAAIAHIAILNGEGTAIGASDVAIPANGARSLRFAAGVGNGLMHCHVTVTDGDKRNLRVAYCVHEGGSTLDSACMTAAAGD